MQKITKISMAILLILLLSGCGQAGSPRQESGENSESFSKEMKLQSSEETSAQPAENLEKLAESAEEPEISNTEIAKLETTLEIYWNTYEELRREAENYDCLGRGMSEAEMQELIQSEILRCYEENTLLAVELKTLVMGSVGVEVPSGFATGDDVLDNYVGYVKDTATGVLSSYADGVVSEIAGDEVKDILKNGISGGVEAYRNSGTLEDVLQGAATSIVDGVSAKIQDGIVNEVTGILDETTGGLFSVAQGISQSGSVSEYLVSRADEETGGLVGTISGLLGYDSTPGALLQSVANSANMNVAEIKNFLNKDTITARDISEMMYAFSTFGNAMQTLASYGVSVNFSWRENYQKIELLYERFTQNEVMIERLSSRGDTLNPQINEIILFELPETEAVVYIENAPGLREEEQGLSNYEKYNILIQQTEELEAALTALKQKVDSILDFSSELQVYQTQLQQIKGDCAKIIDYSVQNFTAGYDTAGIQQMEQFNAVSNAVGEIAKFTPYGIFTNLMTSMAIANTDGYYRTMESVNRSFGEVYEKNVLETREAISELEAQLTFYNDLVKESEDVKEEFENLCLLQYLLDGGDIEIQEYVVSVQKKLCLLAMQIDVMRNIYNTLYKDASFTSTYSAQYNEIMSIIDPIGTGRIASLLSTEEISQALVPILEKGVSAEESLVNTLNSPYDQRFINIHGQYRGRVYFTFSPNNNMTSIKLPPFSIHFFADGEPFCIEGVYIYDGRVLNGPEEADADVLIESAKWIMDSYVPLAGNKLRQELEAHIKAIKIELEK